MKAVILAGGLGTRLSEETVSKPKPMVEIGGKPILWHIMNTYAHFNHKDFYIALGYKAELIKDYFLNYRALNADFTVDLLSGDITHHQVESNNWKVTLVNTGQDSMTGGRVKRMQSYIGDEPFLLTYGDGVADINIDELLAFHKEHGKMVTVSAVRPAARFGELEMNGNQVSNFQEKPQLHEGWINGGYFVINPEFFDLIDGDSTMLEREPLEKLSKTGELMAYKHHDFWQCMDTIREKEILENLWSSNNAKWLK